MLAKPLANFVTLYLYYLHVATLFVVNRLIEQQQQQHLRISQIYTYKKSLQFNSMDIHTNTYFHHTIYTITKFNNLDTANI